jgi:hypothetical protein
MNPQSIFIPPTLTRLGHRLHMSLKSPRTQGGFKEQFRTRLDLQQHPNEPGSRVQQNITLVSHTC